MAKAVNSMYADCSKHLSRRGLGGCHGLSLHTDHGVVTMYITDPYKDGNYRFLVIVAEEGNSFFVQTQLRAVIPKILVDM